jgi:hypothetical protein
MKKNDFLKGYEIGVHDGKREALLELQNLNQNTDLPSNETLYKIFDLLFKCKEQEHATSSCYMNAYEHYANYITTHWNEEIN